MLVSQDNDRQLVPLRQVEGLDGKPEGVFNGSRGEDGPGEVTVVGVEDDGQVVARGEPQHPVQPQFVALDTLDDRVGVMPPDAGLVEDADLVALA